MMVRKDQRWTVVWRKRQTDLSGSKRGFATELGISFGCENQQDVLALTLHFERNLEAKAGIESEMVKAIVRTGQMTSDCYK